MSDSQLVPQALQAFYDSHYFGTAAFTDPWVKVQIGPIKFYFPNPPARRAAIHLHDLTHLVTGYDTSIAGEGEVAAWELASGFPPKYWIGWIYAPLTFSVGVVVAPRRIWRAWKRGWGQMNLYRLDLPREELDRKTLGELKALLGISQ